MPIEISNMSELEAIPNGTTASYILTDDIDATGTTWTSGIGGTGATNSFKGTFNGNGKTVSNLTLDISNVFNGFFRDVYGAFIYDLTINIDLSTTANSVGCFAARIEDNSVILNCHITGTAGYTIGNFGSGAGFAAEITQGSVVSNCSTDLAITVTVPTDGDTGAVAGFISNISDDCVVYKCAVTGTYTGNNRDGTGFCAYSSDASGAYILGCYSALDFSIYSRLRGFALSSNDTLHIENCFVSSDMSVTTTPTGSTGIFPFGSSSSVSFKNNFVNTSAYESGRTPIGATGKTETEMKDITTFSDWDIETSSEYNNETWVINTDELPSHIYSNERFVIEGIVTLFGSPVEDAEIIIINRGLDAFPAKANSLSNGTYKYISYLKINSVHVCVEYKDGDDFYNTESLHNIKPMREVL